MGRTDSIQPELGRQNNRVIVAVYIMMGQPNQHLFFAGECDGCGGRDSRSALELT